MKVFVYALFDIRAPDAIKYVGQTKDLQARMYAHRNGNDPSTHEWVGVLKVEGSVMSAKVLETCDGKPLAKLAEGKWIQKLSPPLNKQLSKELIFRMPDSAIVSFTHLESLYFDWVIKHFGDDKDFVCNALAMNAKQMKRHLGEEFVTRYWAKLDDKATT